MTRPEAGEPLLDITGLSVEFPIGGTWTAVLRDVSFAVNASEAVGLVGESGSGKSVCALSILGLVGAKGGRIAQGEIRFAGESLTRLPGRRLRALRGDRIGMIFQQPIRSLNPAFTVGDHLAETLRRHRGLGRTEAWGKAVALLDRVGIPRAASRAADYPHTFSGGMCQRVMIAMAIACEPKLLIADEPTTALDVTVQARILELLAELRRELGMAILFISHDLAVVAEMCERIVVMYAGEILEDSRTASFFRAPLHPYAAGLVATIPKPGRAHRLAMIPGNIPPPQEMIAGCRFHPRCADKVAGLCDATAPGLERLGLDRRVRCLRAAELQTSERRPA
jgi:oligopeptide/dipeptide ABC transporter ATP-binding protein